jgi:small conductance mechanosensitive channel
MNEQLGTWEHIQREMIDLAIQFGPKVLVAVTIVVAGVYAGKWVGTLVDGALDKFHLELPVKQLLVRVVRLLVLVLFAIMALQNLGVQLLPLVAGLGVAGAGIALAMQGVLSNIMAGLTIIFTKPFRVGEYISIVGEEGIVQDISLFSTILGHADQSRVVIPNRKVVGEILHNYGNIRQLDISVGVAYETNLDQAVEMVGVLLQNDARVLSNPAPVISVSTLTTTAISISIKPWVSVADYGPTQSDLTKGIVNTFRTRGVAIPYYKTSDQGFASAN